MIRVARTLLAVVALVLGSSPEARPSIPVQESGGDDYVLASGRAGRIELGTSADEIYRFFGRDHVRLVDLFKEGMFSPALEITLPGSAVAPAIVVDIREWPCDEFSVWGIDVRDRRFRTSDGFGVGSTAGDLRRSYSLQITEAEGAHAAVIDSLKMSFALTREGPIEQQQVRSVWIWPDPVAVRKRRCPRRDESAFTKESRLTPEWSRRALAQNRARLIRNVSQTKHSKIERDVNSYGTCDIQGRNSHSRCSQLGECSPFLH